MPPLPLILLPPSAGKAAGGSGPPWGALPSRFSQLGDARRRVRAAVDAQIRRRGELTRLFGVSERALPATLDEWAAIDHAPTLPAWVRYTGVVWRHLDPASLGSVARRRLATRVVVVSGLWGLVGATDPIPAYRLPIGAATDVGRLAVFWRDHLGEALEDAAGRGWVFDLLPDDHRPAVDVAKVRRCLVHLVGAAGDRRAMGHAGKAAKGALARAILEHGPTTPAQLARIVVPGLVCVEATSDEVVFQSADG